MTSKKITANDLIANSYGKKHQEMSFKLVGFTRFEKFQDIHGGSILAKLDAKKSANLHAVTCALSRDFSDGTQAQLF